MSIDEAIAKYKEITNTDAICPAHCNIPCEKCLQESEQLVEWLEELKDYRDKNKMVVRIDCANSEQFKDIAVKLAKEQYNKAIDDLSNKICMHFSDWEYSEDDKCIKDIIELASESVEEIAERLKEGGENE